MVAPFESESYCRVVQPRVVFKRYLCPKCRMGAVEEIKYCLTPLRTAYQIKCNRCSAASYIYLSYSAAQRNFWEIASKKK